MTDAIRRQLDLAYAFERRSEWTPPSDGDPGYWAASELDRAQAMDVCLPAAAVIAALSRHLEIGLPAVVARAFELGVPDSAWIADW